MNQIFFDELEKLAVGTKVIKWIRAPYIGTRIKEYLGLPLLYATIATAFIEAMRKAKELVRKK